MQRHQRKIGSQRLLNQRVVLPRHALTNVELTKYARKLNIPNFRGVFMRDELLGALRKPFKNECGIINLDSSVGDGTHWTAYVKKGSSVVYFDSFGDLPPPRELCAYLKDYVISYNHTQFQTYNSVNCGHLCLKFLSQNVL